MKAEIIAVGNEIVTGNTMNTNAGYIAKQIQTLGIMPKFHSAVCDNKKDIQDVLNKSIERAEVIFITGGLGPTEDDLTKEAVCDYLGKDLIIRKDLCDAIENFFRRIGKNMPERNKKQAAFPEDAYILQNDHGTAPGCILNTGECSIVLLPGPPKEMRPMLDHYVLPYFKSKINCNYYTIDIKCFGIGESELAEKIAHLLGESEKASVAPYVGDYEVIVRVTAYGKSEKEAQDIAFEIRNNISRCLGEYIIGYNQDTLENSVFELLQRHNYTIAAAESCTGGLISATLVNRSGISSYFSESIVTYSNEAKMKYLGVSEKTLDAYGAVSKKTAEEMAEGIKLKAKTDIGVAATGIAGPEGGTLEKPVGLVYIAIAIHENTFVYELRLTGTRKDIREKTVKNILFQLYRNLKQI